MAVLDIPRAKEHGAAQYVSGDRGAMAMPADRIVAWMLRTCPVPPDRFVQSKGEWLSPAWWSKSGKGLSPLGLSSVQRSGHDPHATTPRSSTCSSSLLGSGCLRPGGSDAGQCAAVAPGARRGLGTHQHLSRRAVAPPNPFQNRDCSIPEAAKLGGCGRCQECGAGRRRTLCAKPEPLRVRRSLQGNRSTPGCRQTDYYSAAPRGSVIRRLVPESSAAKANPVSRIAWMSV